jgi:uncharacterized protein YfaS (alpha-2-macroglobulin family)
MLVASLVLLAILSNPTLAAKSFRTEQFNYYITDYLAELARLAKTVDKPTADLEAELAAAETADNARLAAVALEKLVSKSPGDAALWLRLADKLAVAEPINDQDGYQLPPKIIGAGLRAYLLATSATDEAAALAIAAQGFGKREYWRPALEAYKESLRLVEDADNRQAYEEMREQHGFRITDYKVENDATPPRVCFELSDPVSNAVTDFAPYFRQEPGSVSAVSVEGTKLCIEGIEHGTRYKVTARKGLPSAVEEDLAKDYDYEFYVRDRNPAVRFSGKSYVLPRTGQNGVPLISVNSSEAKIALYRVGDRSLIDNVIDSNFLSQIDGYAAESIADRKGSKVWEGTLATPAPLNEEVTTAFPVDEALGKLEPGLYVMTAEPASRKADEYENIATQWFVVSDLGLSTMKGNDGLHVSVRSIATASPIESVDIRLIARNNEVLATAKTAADGSAIFDAGLLKGRGGDEPALVVALGPDKDYGFLDITQAAFDLTDRGVAGRDASGAIDAFVYVERGVYRRGEAVHAAVLLRDDRANAVPDAPLTVIVERPDGVEYSRTSLADQGAGGRTLDIPIIKSAAGGTWRVKAYTDPKSAPVGETSFLVEDYIPDRIEFDLTTLSQTASADEVARFAVDGRYLFGAPGAGLELEGDVSVGADDHPFAQWNGYRFGLTDERVDNVQMSAEGLPQTDAKGHADLTLPLPELPTTSRPLKADFTVRMREPGGRAVEKDATLSVRSARPLLGIRPGFDVGGAPEGQPITFDLIAIDPSGKPIEAKTAVWSLKRLTTTYQWFNADGNWRYEAVTRAAKIAGNPISIGADKPATLSQSLAWGEYRLEIAADGFSPASIDFSSGYYYNSGAEADTPDTLQLALDKTSVKTGDTLNLKIDTRFAGKASLQIVGGKLLASKSIDVPEGGVTVPIPVEKGWGTGAYALVTQFRPIDIAAKRMPSRAIGVAWFGIDRDERTLDVKLAPVQTMKPRQPLKIPVKIGGLSAGEQAYVTVAAVDVGILNLTRYKPPAPENYYYDQKRLTAELRDLYGRLIDGMQGARGRIRSGGDSGGAWGAPPPTQPPLSLFSGLGQVGADGTAEVSFDIPAFNGTVRVMAVAWTGTKVGHASTDVIVRDPLVIAGTLPRFLAVGDQSRFRLDLINAEAAPGDYQLAVMVDGPVSADAASLHRTITIGASGTRVPVNIPITAHAAGKATLMAVITGAGGVDIDQTYALSVLPANPMVTRRITKEIAANGGAITISNDLLAEMVAGTGALALSVGPLPELDAAGLIRELDRYPYGCSEQTVSRALPLLYLSDLGASDVIVAGSLKDRLQDAVSRLANRQSANGAFGMWSAGMGDDNLWLSSFVTDFLLRAREKSFAVPEDVLVNALDYLKNTIGNAPDIENGKGEDIAYALYVLARAGRAPAGDLKYLADTKIDDFGSPLARAQIAAALAIIGDKPRADQAFASALAALEAAESNSERPYRYDYGSPLRDASGLLALASDTRSGASVIKAAAQVVISERARTRYTSTQEMTWMVLAARAMAEEAAGLKLNVNGTPQTGALYKLFSEGELEKPYQVTNLNTDPLRAVIAVTGSPTVAEPASSNGLTIARDYYTPSGEPIDPSTVKQNTRLVVVLSATAPGSAEQNGNFLLVDRLPAGFEIENPALVSSGDTSGLSWLEGTSDASHAEFRDDRFVAAFTSAPAKFAYTIRVVAPGAYVHPGASVEDMYRPELNARTGTGAVTVTEP